MKHFLLLIAVMSVLAASLVQHCALQHRTRLQADLQELIVDFERRDKELTRLKLEGEK